MPTYIFKCPHCQREVDRVCREAEKDEDFCCTNCNEVIQGRGCRILSSTYFTGAKQKGKYNSLGG